MSAAVVDAIKTPISHPNAGYQIVQPLFQMMPDAQIMDPKLYTMDCQKYDMLNLTKNQKD